VVQERPDARRHLRGRRAITADVGDNRGDAARGVLEHLEEVAAVAEARRLFRGDAQVGAQRKIDGAAVRDGGQLAGRRRERSKVQEVHGRHRSGSARE
jgi:hypothetical protein